MNWTWASLLLVLCLLLPAAAPCEAKDPDYRGRIPWLSANLRSALIAYQQSPTAENLEHVLIALPKSSSTVAGQPIYMVEGDIPFALPQTCRWIQQITGRVAPAGSKCEQTNSSSTVLDPKERRELRIAKDERCGKNADGTAAICIWNTDERAKLTYNINEKSFTDAGVEKPALDAFRLAFEAAIKGWNKLCKETVCGLKISPSPFRDAEEHFEVKYGSDSELDCINGSAFIPHFGLPRELKVGKLFFAYRGGNSAEVKRCVCAETDTPAECRQRIAAAGWETRWAHTLKHEIGHTLGYVHEQLSAEGWKKCAIDDIAPPDTTEHPDWGSIMHSSGCFNPLADPKDKLRFKMTGKFSTGDEEVHGCYYNKNQCERP